MINKNILWIEDEPEGCGVNSRIEMLEIKGYEVILAKEVDIALVYIQERKFDLILLDIMMPPGNAFKNDPDVKEGYETGLAFAKELKKKNINTPVIVITAYPNGEIENIFRDKYEVKYYFQKPINQIQLEEAIENLLWCKSNE